MPDNMSVENEDYFDGRANLLMDEDVEDTSMDVNLSEKPDVKLHPGSPFSGYSPEEESILIKLKIGGRSMQEVQTYKEQLQKEQWSSSENLPDGWMYKVFGDELKLLGRGGQLFENMNEAFEFVEEYQAYFRKDDMMKIFLFGEDKSLFSTPPVAMKEEDIEKVKSLEVFAESSKSKDRGGAGENSLDASWTKNDPTVPQGWMIRKAGGANLKNCYHVLSPDKKHFAGRRVALKYLIDNNYSEDEIEAMRECLKFDGWIMDSKLPSKWFYKTHKDNTHLFIDSEGNYFQSKDTALKYHVKEKGENNETLLMLQNFINNIVSVHNSGRGIDSSWRRNDPRVPKGWMIKEKQNGPVKNILLLSPEERYFSGYRYALKFLIENNNPEETIEDMRQCMKFDGWLQDPKLPTKWFYKALKNHSNQYIDSEANYFQSKDAALRYHVKEKGENSETVKKLRDFINNLVPVYRSRNGQGIDSKWRRNDPRVPKGWLIKERQNGLVKNYHLLSPEERYFSGYRLALKFLIENNSPEEIIEDMRQCMKNDAWFPVPSLANGWLYKKSNGYKHSFIDPLGSYYESRERALKMLVSQGRKEVVQSLLRFCETLGKCSDNPENIKKSTSDKTWLKDDPSVPAGWMVKYVQLGTNTITKLMSPNGQMIQGRKLALKHMIQQNYPNNLIEEMKGCLKIEGWSENETLLKDWLYKSSRKGTSFIDSDGAYFRTKEQALKMLVSQGKKEVSQNLLIFCDNLDKCSDNQINIEKITSDKTWLKDDSSVPSGWMLKYVHFGANTVTRLMSPNGHLIQGRRLALKYMIQQNYPVDQIAEMKACLKVEGWYFNEGLPKDWLYKSSKDGTAFIDSNGAHFQNKEQALKHLVGKTEFLETYNILKAFDISPRKSTSVSDDWKEFDSDPLKGWKCKVDSAGRHRYLSPSGDNISGKKHVMKFLVKNNYSQDVISAMRTAVKSERSAA